MDRLGGFPTCRTPTRSWSELRWPHHPEFVHRSFRRRADNLNRPSVRGYLAYLVVWHHPAPTPGKNPSQDLTPHCPPREAQAQLGSSGPSSQNGDRHHDNAGHADAGHACALVGASPSFIEASIGGFSIDSVRQVLRCIAVTPKSASTPCRSAL